MTENSRWFERIGRLGLPARAGLVAGVLAIAFVPSVPVAILAGGANGVLASLVACLICISAGLAALFVSSIFRGPEFAMPAMMMGMMLRMGLPLVATVVIYLQGGVLADGGTALYLLFFYVVMLSVETILALPQVEAMNQSEAR